MRGFLWGCVVGAVVALVVVRMTAPSTEDIRALERSEQALSERLHRAEKAVAHDTVRVVRFIADWGTLRAQVAATPDSGLSLPLRQHILVWGDSLTAACADLKTDVAVALPTADSGLANLDTQRNDWKRIARGKFLRVGAEVTYGSLWQPALDVTAGHRWSAVARVELPVNHPPVMRYGVRYEF